jgi:hypothetical protein
VRYNAHTCSSGIQTSGSLETSQFDGILNYVALGMLIFVVVTLFYGIIAIHDIPYDIANARGHPHQDAIHAGWVSLFTLHAIWPFLWIWAMLYQPDRGWGFKLATDIDPAIQMGALKDLIGRVEVLEKGRSPQRHKDPKRWTPSGDLDGPGSPRSVKGT